MKTGLIVVLLVAAAGRAFGQTKDFAERDPRYRLQPTDVLEVHYRYTPEFDQTVSLQPDGFVTLPIVGDVKLQGLNLDQAKAAIQERASQRLQNPEITIILKDFEKPYFVVGGEVAHPGKFEMRGQITAIEAISMAGGFKTGSAKHSQVILFRKVGDDLARTQILNLKTAINPSASAAEAVTDLRSGDLLMVPQNTVSKIERYIKWVNVGLYANPIP
jgi:polysaccharide export outer membrane protein